MTLDLGPKEDAYVNSRPASQKLGAAELLAMVDAINAKMDETAIALVELVEGMSLEAREELNEALDAARASIPADPTIPVALGLSTGEVGEPYRFWSLATLGAQVSLMNTAAIEVSGTTALDHGFWYDRWLALTAAFTLQVFANVRLGTSGKLLVNRGSNALTFGTNVRQMGVWPDPLPTGEFWISYKAYARGATPSLDVWYSGGVTA